MKKEFLETTVKAYQECGRVLLQKMPLKNKALRCFAGLNSSLRGTDKAQRMMIRLKDVVKHFLPGEEDDFELEVRKFQTDNTLPTFTEDCEDDDAGAKKNEKKKKRETTDEWWAAVDSRTYPHLTKLVKAALSSFHGPMVESSFSIMTEVIDQRNTSMEIDTFAVIQTVKYALKVAGKNTQVLWQDQPLERSCQRCTDQKHEEGLEVQRGKETEQQSSK